MAAVLGPKVQKERVLASSTVVAATPSDSSLVEVLGAKAVYFIVRSTTAGETDAFTEPDLIGLTAADAGATTVVTSPAASNSLGVLTVNASACVTAGNVGYVLAVVPDGHGTDAGGVPPGRFACHSLGIRVNAHATNDISTVIVDAVVVYD